MHIQNILTYVGTNKIENILEIAYGIHKQSLDNTSLNSSFQVALTFASGLSVRGYIIGLDKSSKMVTIASFLNNEQSYNVQYIELNGIQSVGIENFEKNATAFCKNQIPEGIGTPPTILVLKRELLEVEKTLQNTAHSNLKIQIDWTAIDKDVHRTVWAIDGILKQITQLTLLVKGDVDFINALNESVKHIKIIDSKASKMSIEQDVLIIPFVFSSGLVGVVQAETIHEFLSKNL